MRPWAPRRRTNAHPAAGRLRAPLLAAALVLPALLRAALFDVAIEPREGERFKSAAYRLWIPDGVEVVRGLILHQHGCGRNGLDAAHDVHWQALAAVWDCVLVGTHYEAATDCGDWSLPEHGSERAFLAAIEAFAAQTKHPEIAEAPWVLWGHSGGASWVTATLCRFPERVVAVFARSGVRGSDFSHARGVPIMFCLGVREEKDFPELWASVRARFAELRQAGATACLAIDPKASHDCGNSRLLCIPFFDACLRRRLPDPGSSVRALAPMDTSRAWLGDSATAVIAPAESYAGDKAQTSWLPDEATARRWREFVRTGTVTDATPPHAAPCDLQVIAATGTSVTLAWRAVADLESGNKAFRIFRNGAHVGNLGAPREQSHNPEGGFQKGNFGDEPTAAGVDAQGRVFVAPRMQFTDSGVLPGTAYTYEVETVNWSGLASKRSAPCKVATPANVRS